MAATPTQFPVQVTKGTGKDKITRTAHSLIAFRQLETEGFTLAAGSKKAAEQEKPEEKSDAKPASNKSSK